MLTSQPYFDQPVTHTGLVVRLVVCRRPGLRTSVFEPELRLMPWTDDTAILDLSLGKRSTQVRAALGQGMHRVSTPDKHQILAARSYMCRPVLLQVDKRHDGPER